MVGTHGTHLGWAMGKGAPDPRSTSEGSKEPKLLKFTLRLYIGMSVPPMLTKNLTYFKSVLCLSQKRDQGEPSNEVY